MPLVNPLFFLLLISFSLATLIPFNVCSEIKTFTISTIEGLPWPPVSGLASVITFTGKFNKKVDSLNLYTDLWMKVGSSWISVPQLSKDLCKLELYCPLNDGTTSFKIRFEVPPITPIGTKWKGQFQFKSNNGTLFSCSEFGPVLVK
ncbi:hypothetical protein EHI8A_127350 [Entamoeba histolytica HM-1:IMSS-B]|uniref:MD-2-related lipid-recognition domain-containing protein n=6 Tax=Entamoeba histolytica TaxID=5759 RepID=C4M2U4_ENTH1|nr:hypothetical protein EHI_188770 [Entamoeba histolytica HM-1:IMSS]EMD46272.1 Hypothetical protein EHI5A_158150 [Entamoeba histolytica KU27]EMH74138.1 hypothetical protein EHI8A_127350 [Entamoeba histolytica HM-1:IMSS-B]EMS15905.1 hypothetical protein KM1_200130 [Entamoeba histolytica HM-3:IMSS]ENY60217.1 hypothetical protein EHI7A_119330 [Entamoeba histolytica HM-1:IMSS-A]GAT95615.1 hypothetical protein CL6EHI_188770 [Entamoeba histolytica]|eukprot:XP_655171.1 hypothetical protein EHI_188770 [Entamoeba histolytica HM-1:IMSS]